MISELLQDIVNTIGNTAQKAIVVIDTDGLLAGQAVRGQLSATLGMPVVVAEGLALRIYYELKIRRDSNAKVCFVSKSSKPILPDIAVNARICNISLADLFPNFTDRETLKSLDFDTLADLYAKHIQGRVTSTRLQQLISDSQTVAEPKAESAITTISKCAEAPDWTDTEYIATLSKAFKQALARREYNADIAQMIWNINFDFQHFIQENYFAMLNAAGGPKAVHAVAPYLQSRFGTNDKLAFIVIDGMAWWQWEVLRDELENLNLIALPEVKAIMAWLPSITALSRQALFRGESPLIDYHQSPSEEEKLWKSMWRANPVFTPVYQHNVILPEELNTATRRLAIVDVQLDKKMHQSSDYYDLYDLTKNWAMKFVKIIAKLRSEDFHIVLTTDHGNVFATGKGSLKPEEKVHLYLANSRGERFVYFTTKELKEQFRSRNYAIPFFENPRENWLSIADDSSFSTPRKQLITHGGSHFMETVIPLIIF
jgi:hypothetical protein